ncbi:ACP S-malonyltransferase [Cysteiniphilum sp. QT6929]|uniref:ACP S-malonyltransferase n=1 Tax=Cysteiniphilum sp. QT6929 TaxID=2975055 RepID=UPI0024B32B99|nr:ACP S-malonyltransferase [Cysteiniphilum sp. QT6929]WHN65542.1 ACP S-malonyltransferase [Cysteiniphilum sp. QT6929]
MTKTAIVFPGQGSQKLGMLDDYYARFNEVKQTFTEANDALGFDLWQITQENEDKLNQTEYTQPALLAASIAIWRVLNNHSNITPEILAGHSLGEYSALCAAGSIDFADALRLVRLRGQLMQSAITDKACAMSAILALSNEEVIKCCDAARSAGIVEPANFNSHGQVVISGELKAVEKANEIAKEMGAKRAQLLPVSVPSHCSLMKEAADKFATALDKITIKVPAIKVIHNYDIQSHTDINEIKTALVKQLYSPVKWTQTIEKMAELGITNVIECGANKVLTGLNKRIVKELNYQDTASVETMDKLLEQVKA